MNWTDLSDGLTSALREILQEAYVNKPAGLLEYVATELEARSGLPAADFEHSFEEAKKQKRTYKLEDNCPANVDPLIWIPRRYDDEAILVFLRSQGRETAEVAKRATLETELLQATFPEFAYLRDKPEKLRWLLCYMKICGEVTNPDVPNSPHHPLILDLQEQIEDTGEPFDFEEACAAGLLRVLSTLPEFEAETGGAYGCAYSCFEARPSLFPTIVRTDRASQNRIKILTSLAFFEEFHNGELLPASLSKLKEVPSMPSLFCMYVAEFLAGQEAEGAFLTDAVIKKVQRAVTALADVGTKTPHIVASQYLEKTALASGYPFDKASLICRAVVRFALLTGLEQTPDGTARVDAAFQELSASEKHTLQRELCKDGLLQYPAFSLIRAHKLLSVAAQNPDIPLVSALRLFTGIITEAASEAAGAQLSESSNLTLDFGQLVPIAEQLASDSPPLDATATMLERTGSSIVVQVHRV